MLKTGGWGRVAQPGFVATMYIVYVASYCISIYKLDLFNESFFSIGPYNFNNLALYFKINGFFF